MQLSFQIPKQECSQVPRQVCSNVPKQDCQPVERQECTTVPRQECQQVPRQSCQQIPVQNCQNVPRQECVPTTREICETVPTQNCQQTPSQNCQQVSYISYHIIKLCMLGFWYPYFSRLKISLILFVCWFEWTPFWMMESGYPIIRNFASCPGLAPMVKPLPWQSWQQKKLLP